MFAISYNIYSLGLYGSYLLVTGINGEVLTESVAMSSSAGRNENICLRALDSQTLRIGTAVILVEQVFAFCQLQRSASTIAGPRFIFFSEAETLLQSITPRWLPISLAWLPSPSVRDREQSR